MPAAAPSKAEVLSEFDRLNREVLKEKQAEQERGEELAPAKRPLQFNSREYGWLPAEEQQLLSRDINRRARPGTKNLRVKLPFGEEIIRLSVPPLGTEVRLPNGLSVRPDQVSPEWRELLAEKGYTVETLPPGRVYREV